MSPRGRTRGRTEACGSREAQAKLRRAEQFMEVATLIKDEPDPDWASAAAALAVLAGISASDAACCKALGLGRAVRITTTPKPCSSRSNTAGRMPPMRCAA